MRAFVSGVLLVAIAVAVVLTVGKPFFDNTAGATANSANSAITTETSNIVAP